MIHLNGNLLCAVDVETTGLIPRFHDIIQVCVLPLDSDLKPYTKILPFYCDLKPKRPENIDHKALKVSRSQLCDIMVKGLDPYMAADLFDEWFKKLNLAFNKYISPLASNWVFDREFLMDWLGPINFNAHFDARYRDTQACALYDNDRADIRSDAYPYPKVALKYLCSQLKVEHTRAHDALQDCIATAEVYRRMLRQ